MKLALAIIAAITLGAAATPASAQVIPASQVLADCPDVPAAQACPALAAAFLGNRAPTVRRDGRIVNLVVAIAEAAQQPRVPRRACLNAADGLRVLATGVTKEEQATQINDIADALCIGSRTASIFGPRRFGLFESLSSQGGGGGGGGSGGGGATTTPPVIINPPGGGGECTSNCPPTGTTGSLGSFGAAKSPNEKALENANDNALNNFNGQNTQPHGNSQAQAQAQSSQASTEESEQTTGNRPADTGSQSNRPAGAGNPNL